MKHPEDKWQHFTDTELDVLYSALADYRKKHKDDIVTRPAYETADRLCQDLAYATAGGNQ